MPVMDVKEIAGFAHCANYGGRCPGYAQEPVPAIREETGWTFQEQGGDIPGIERSQVRIKFANPDADQSCPSCGGDREVTDQARKVYQEMIPARDVEIPAPAAPAGVDDQRIADLEAKIDALTKALGD